MVFYVKNVPPGERVLRVVAGVVVAGLALRGLDGLLGWAVAAGAAGIVASGLFGFCPACAMVGRKLKQGR